MQTRPRPQAVLFRNGTRKLLSQTPGKHCTNMGQSAIFIVYAAFLTNLMPGPKTKARESSPGLLVRHCFQSSARVWALLGAQKRLSLGSTFAMNASSEAWSPA
jgi:hypothetical protein